MTVTWTAPAIFQGLRSVTSDQLDEVMAGFTAAQWTHLEQGFLDQVATDALEHLDVLGFDLNGDTDDALVILWRLYRQSDQRRPQRWQTTGGIR